MSQRIAALNAVISADAKQFADGVVLTKKELRDAAKVMESVKTPAQKYADEVAHLNKMAAAGAIDQKTLAKATAEAKERFGQQTGLDRFNSQISSLTGKITAMGPAGMAASGALVGIGVAAKAAQVGVSILNSAIAKGMEQAEEIDKVAKMARGLGVGSRFLVGLHHGAGLSGGSVEDVNKALDKLQQNLGMADGKGKAVFARLGLDADKLKRMQPEQAFREVVTALNAVPNQADRARMSVEIFGKSAENLKETFAAGADAIDEWAKEAEALGLTFNEIEAGKVEAMNDSLSKMQKIWDGIGNKIAIEIAPHVKALADNVTELFKQHKGNIFDGLATSAHMASAAVGVLGDGVESLLNRVDALSKPQEGGFWTTLGRGGGNLASFAPGSIGALGGLTAGVTGAIEDGMDAAADGPKAKSFSERMRESMEAEMARPIKLPTPPDSDGDEDGLDIETVKDLTSQHEAFIAKLREEADSYGMTANEIALWRLEHEGASEAIITETIAIQKQIEQMKERDKRMKEDADRIKAHAKEVEGFAKKFRTPFEEAQDEIARINDLIDKGLSKEIASRAFQKIDDDFLKATADKPEKERRDTTDRSAATAVRKGSAEAFRLQFAQRFKGLEKPKPVEQQQLQVQREQLRELKALRSNQPKVASI